MKVQGKITVINREDLIKTQRKDGYIYTKDFHILLEEVIIIKYEVQCLINYDNHIRGWSLKDYTWILNL